MVVETPTYYKSAGNLVIYKGGKTFYAKDEPCTFTLPPGTYRIEGSIVPVGPMEKRPWPGGVPRFALPRTFSVVWLRNPNKATIMLDVGRIILDPSFRSAPDPVLTFILCHEIAHLFHKSEPDADEYAARAMWAMGYNPSQIHAAAKLALSSCSASRVHAVETLVKNG